MGWWMKRWRPGKVGEASAVGAVLLLAALVAGGWVAGQPQLGPLFTHSATTLTGMMMAYGFIASVLPVWMLLCPRDYLSTFLKITTILVLAIAILVILPPLRMPALTPFATLGEGPVSAGKLFPFAFITIACGAISGFHSLVASGTTPKMIAREADARLIGYGGMLIESFVGVMAMIAACTLDPGVYFAMNTTPTGLAQASQVLSQAGLEVTPDIMHQLAAQIGGDALLSRSAGQPSAGGGRQRFAWVTLTPLACLVTVTMTAGWQKVLSADPKLGFLAHAASLTGSTLPGAQRLVFNDRLNTFVALLFMTVVTVLIVTSVREWWLVLSRRKTAVVHEAPYVETGYATGD